MYFDVLNKIKEENNINFEEMFVIGDIYELDLALPSFFNANVCFLPPSNVPEYERKFVKNLENGWVIENLEESLEIIKNLV